MDNSSQSYGMSPAIWDHLPPDTGERALPKLQSDRRVLT